LKLTPPGWPPVATRLVLMLFLSLPLHAAQPAFECLPASDLARVFEDGYGPFEPQPGPSSSLAWRAASDFLHGLAPDLRRIDAIETPHCLAALEVWVPKLDHLAAWHAAYEQAQRQGIKRRILAIHQRQVTTRPTIRPRLTTAMRVACRLSPATTNRSAPTWAGAMFSSPLNWT